MTDGNSKLEKKHYKKVKAPRVKTKTVNVEDNLKLDPLFKPGRGRPKKKSASISDGKDHNKYLVKKLSHSSSLDSSTKLSNKDSSLSVRRSKRDDRNFVKITGSFQDDFVYYTTKNKRCRPRKETIPTTELIPEPKTKPQNTQSQGVNVFDWYRDLARSDKSSRFGASESSSSTPIGDDTSQAASLTQQDSDVMDIVCELSSLPTTTSTGVSTDNQNKVNDLNNVDTDLHSMAEQVRSMLNNMNQNDIQNVLQNTLETPSFDNFGLSTTGQQLGDLDDINDQDLLYNSDMSSIMSDLPSNTSSMKTNSTTNNVESFSNTTVPATAVNHSAPDLTVVSMYWNDLPGLTINSRQYVRLVDIHKQMLPAKDTGILKKRCQMMGLNVCNCSELQRDFLIRYANAAKSKSTVIVDKEGAKNLISFYVEPRAKTPRQASPIESYVKSHSGMLFFLLARVQFNLFYFSEKSKLLLISLFAK